MRIAVVFDTPYRGREDADFKQAAAAGQKEAEYEVANALQALGHEILLLGVNDDFHPMLEQLAVFKPDLVFNAAEGFAGKPGLDYLFPALLEAEGYRYTGSPPLGLVLTRNKEASKKVLAYEGIKVPGFATFPPGDKFRPPELAYPLIVKPLAEDASIGIAQASVVGTVEALEERITFVHERFTQPAIVEEFIDGREFYVGILGNRDRLQVLPIIEMTFDKDKTTPFERIATRAAKWDDEYRARKGIKNVLARPMAQGVREEMERVCLAAYRVLWLHDYARIDVRLAEDNQVWVIEANANPFISIGHEMANAAEKDGMNYQAFIARLVSEAMARYGESA
jgi:D-alanine-D-alanine ligase